MKIAVWPICLVLTSCGVYNSSFDCPPGKGIGCAPVNEVLNMIVEREDGEDLFITDPGTALLLRQQEQEAARPQRKKKLRLVKEDSGELVFMEDQEAR
jgi:hypothetical protein